MDLLANLNLEGVVLKSDGQPSEPGCIFKFWNPASHVLEDRVDSIRIFPPKWLRPADIVGGRPLGPKSAEANRPFKGAYDESMEDYGSSRTGHLEQIADRHVPLAPSFPSLETEIARDSSPGHGRGVAGNRIYQDSVADGRDDFVHRIADQLVGRVSTRGRLAGASLRSPVG